MASDRRTQIPGLLWAYAKGDEQSKMPLKSAIRSIPENDIVEVLSYGYDYNIFQNIWYYYTKQNLARLFRRCDDQSAIHRAVHRGDLNLIELILEEVKPDNVYSLLKKQTHSNQRTAVHYAAEKDYATTLKWMRTALQCDRKWCDIISIQDHSGRTAVHAAAVKSKTDAIHAMLRDLEQNFEILKILDEKGNTALHLAAEAADSNTMRELTRELDKTKMYYLLTIQNKGILNTTIHLIAEHGDATDVLCLILQVGEAQVEAVLTIPNADGDTAEHIARGRKERTLVYEMRSQLRKAKKKNCSSSVPPPPILSRPTGYGEREPVTPAIVGHTQLEGNTEPGGNIHPEDEALAEEKTQADVRIQMDDI